MPHTSLLDLAERKLGLFFARGAIFRSDARKTGGAARKGGNAAIPCPLHPGPNTPQGAGQDAPPETSGACAAQATLKACLRNAGSARVGAVPPFPPAPFRLFAPARTKPEGMP